MYYRQPFEGSYPITQRFGEKVTSSFHTGIDYACPLGTPILSSEAGEVMFAGYDSTGFGYCVIIQHKDGNATLYAHMTMTAVQVGNKIEQSKVVGYSGSTGNSTGPHLHFEARHQWNDSKSHFDPMSLPLHSVYDEAPDLKGADELGPDVEIVAPAGAWAWNKDFSKRVTVFPDGTKLHFTGETVLHGGYEYCEVYPEPVKYWVAVNDYTTQILDNQGPS